MSTPLATYRVQLTPAFGFDDAAAIVPYLAKLGITHLYCSPYLQAVHGSTHGYDVVDHRQVNSELGGPEAHARLCQALSTHGLGQVLDIVPNHMAIGSPDNRWWWDVLEYGPASRYATYFDVDWEPLEARPNVKVLLPVLGDHYGRVLESGQIKVERNGVDFVLRYFDQTWPVFPRSLRGLLAEAAQRSASPDLAYLAEALGTLPLPSLAGPEERSRLYVDTRALLEQLGQLLAVPSLARALDSVLDAINGDPSALDALHERQHYRLAYWRAAHLELGYRRFFDINTLVGLRVESEPVFADTHALVIDWVSAGQLDGLRIDHPDGLRDPESYLTRLRRAAPRAWVVVEKILEPEEDLPGSWPVDGTTGYEFVNVANGLFVSPAGEEALTSLYAEFTGESRRYDEVAGEKKRFALRQILGSDLNRLAALFQNICEGHWRYRDYLRPEVEEVLVEVIACLQVYRTYVRPDIRAITETDRSHIEKAVEAAKARRPDLDVDLLDFLRSILLLEVRGGLEAELVLRLQQMSGPVMAKGIEDTAFYCYNRLISLNEVGGDPGRFGVSPEEFHRFCVKAQQRHPAAMLASSTHDTKRSEDVRARINLLSEIPGAWGTAVHNWGRCNERHRAGGWPDRNAEYLFYQTLAGAWPIGVDRMTAYMEKATREAKVHTSWTRPDEGYDSALRGFIEAAMNDTEFLEDIARFVEPLVEPGRINSLAQLLLKLTAPGVPDIYQGTELWDLSLVDPDNRRPVDYGLRRELMEALASMTAEDVRTLPDDGAPKLFLLQRALAVRQTAPHLFSSGAHYQPLYAEGARSSHLVAFARSTADGEAAITVVPRLILGLDGDWGDTALSLPDGAWEHRLTGEMVESGPVSVQQLLKRFPVALLTRP